MLKQEGYGKIKSVDKASAKTEQKRSGRAIVDGAVGIAKLRWKDQP